MSVARTGLDSIGSVGYIQFWNHEKKKSYMFGWKLSYFEEKKSVKEIEIVLLCANYLK